MASGALGADEPPKEREKHRWSENSKVYSRKIFKATKNNANSNPISSATAITTVTPPTPAPVPAPASASTNTQINEDKNKNTAKEAANEPNKSSEANENIHIETESNHVDIENDHVANGTAAAEERETERENAPEKSKCKSKSPSPVRVPVEEACSSQPQQVSSRLETASDDSFSHNRPDEAGVVPNGHDRGLVNGVVRPVVTRLDDRVNISVSAAVAGPKDKVRNLKRKLEDELDQVRKMARRLEDKEIQLSGYSGSGNGIGVGGITAAPAVGSFQQFPVNGGLDRGLDGHFMVNSDTGSVGYNDMTRPLRPLSVSVMDNNYGVSEFPEKEKRTPKANQFYRNSEFILGKEKLPPAESNRKSKSSGGKKHGSRDSDYGYGYDKQAFKNCGSLLQRLMKHRHGWVFNQPVDVKKLGLHDYFDIIKHPMDLGTIKTRLSKNWYKTPREFAEDVRLTFHNAMTYNPEGQDVHIMAKELLGIFEDKWPAIEAEYDRKLRYEIMRDLGAPTPTSRKTYVPSYAPLPMSLGPPPPLLHQPPPLQEVPHLDRSHSMPVGPESRSKPTYPVARTPAPKKPKAKDPNKRNMTFEEKQRLSTNLQGLPSEKLDAIVQIIKKRNSALSQHDDEIEVDIDSVDAETLWELDRFVTNYKKSLSKNKRKAELALQRAAAVQAAQQALPAPAVNVTPQETRIDEGNVPTSPQVEQARHDDNASESSSSSSSSSDSGSSSSDSDSDSSSDSESDGGR